MKTKKNYSQTKYIGSWDIIEKVKDNDTISNLSF